MELKIKTELFQAMVAKAVRGASENKLLPITSMMAIEVKDKVLTLTTTDTANTLKVYTKLEAPDFYVVVPVDKFSKLIAKSTSEYITLTVNENNLDVKSNGEYKIEMPADEDGFVKFPEYKFNKTTEGVLVNMRVLKAVANTNKAALAKTLENPCLCGYYVGEQVITTDENVICLNDVNLLDENVLISPEMMDLVCLNESENVMFFHTGDSFLFEGEGITVYGAEHDGKELYPVEDILGYVDVEFPSSCTLPRLYLQDVIDRLSLFIEPYDKNGAYFTFTPEGVQINSRKSSSDELIKYASVKGFEPFKCCVDIPMLKAQIDSVESESIEVHFGHEAALKLVSGNVTQFIALLEDDSNED